MDWIIGYIKEQSIFNIGQFSVAAIFLALIYIFIRHRLSGTRNRQEFRRKAAEEFSNAFTEALCLLGEDCVYDVAVKSDSPKVYDILERDIVDHKTAMLRYRRYLGWFGKMRFDFAWRKHYSKDKADYYLCDYESRLHPKTGKPEPEYEKKLMKLARKRINKLLKFAKIK